MQLFVLLHETIRSISEGIKQQIALHTVLVGIFFSVLLIAEHVFEMTNCTCRRYKQSNKTNTKHEHTYLYTFTHDQTEENI